MGCDDVRTSLPAYVDGELPATEALAIAAHLSGCEACAIEHEGLREAVSAIHGQFPMLRAPDALRARVTGAPRVLSLSRWNPRAWGIAASFMVLAAAAYTAGAYGRSASEPGMADQALAAHLRSLQAAHLTDVASADQHTVKPWFAGKLPFAPPVRRLEAQGFLLLGGRLDYLAGRPVAALVYQRRAHLINVMVYPDPSTSASAPTIVSRDGFQLAHWSTEGFGYWVVSDLNANELQTFCSLLKTHAE